jgi:hypothetical protein
MLRHEKWKPYHQDCSVRWRRTIQIVEWNFVDGFCPCFMIENFFLISLFGLMRPLSNLMVLSVDTTVCTGSTKIHEQQKNEQIIHEGCQCGAVCLPEDLEGLFCLKQLSGSAYFSVLQDNIVPSVKDLCLEEGCYFQQDGAPPLFHSDVRSFKNIHFPGWWIGRRGRQTIHPDLLTYNY